MIVSAKPFVEDTGFPLERKATRGSYLINVTNLYVPNILVMPTSGESKAQYTVCDYNKPVVHPQPIRQARPC